ncbi:cell division protein FtsB [Collimonas sp.]|jgi:cell division protein FtsB|uniref:cell division protein FtsB n=1 Tax=Collimonas sp. TaxID=1963772 RepID=UPI0037BED283
MRLIAIFLTVLLILVQYPLWLGKGGWLRVWDMDQQVRAAHDKIDELKARNAKLDSEVHDLKEGTGAVEERARSELGMIKQGEIFVQILDPNGNPADAPSPPNPELTAVEKTVAVAVPDERVKKPHP